MIVTITRANSKEFFNGLNVVVKFIDDFEGQGAASSHLLSSRTHTLCAVPLHSGKLCENMQWRPVTLDVSRQKRLALTGFFFAAGGTRQEKPCQFGHA